jgi:hypothetical protein
VLDDAAASFVFGLKPPGIGAGNGLLITDTAIPSLRFVGAAEHFLAVAVEHRESERFQEAAFHFQHVVQAVAVGSECRGHVRFNGARDGGNVGVARGRQARARHFGWSAGAAGLLLMPAGDFL